VGQLDQFAKQVFAEETEHVTGGAALWQKPPELNLSEVRLDGLLLVRDPARLRVLAAPWCEAVGQADELIIELKMPGDHLDMLAVERTLLRRQARQVERMEASWDGDEPVWLVAPHVSRALAARRELQPAAPGCYRVGPSAFPFLWIAANELPLVDELIPFLMARSGKALDEFCLWVMTRRSPEWLARMVEFLPMSTATYREMTHYVATKTDDPTIRERQLGLLRALMEANPEVGQELKKEEARANLRRVLAHRKLVANPDDEARIDACADLATIERWHEQALDATSAGEALR
jgi:hypothetical protein